MLFLALKKVRVVKITPCLIPITQYKNPPSKFPIPLPLTITWKTLGKGPSLLKFVSLFQVKFSFSIDNVFSEFYHDIKNALI